MIALQCCVNFCCTSWISCKYTYILSLLSLPPTPLPSHSSRSSWNTELSSLCSIAASHELSVSHTVYMSVLLSQFVPPSPVCTSPSLCLRLYSCPANRFIGYRFSRFHTYALKYNSFWITSLCGTDSRFIHIATNNPVSFLFMHESYSFPYFLAFSITSHQALFPLTLDGCCRTQFVLQEHLSTRCISSNIAATQPAPHTVDPQ